MAFESLTAFGLQLPGQLLGFLLNNLLPAIIWLIIGLIAGKVTYKIVQEILVKANVDKMSALKKAQFKTSHVLATIAKWMLYLVFIGQAGEALAIVFVTAAIGGVLAFLPELAVSVVVFLAGYVLAKFSEKLVRQAGGGYAALMSKLVFFFAIYVSLVVALQQISFINAQLLSSILLILIASFGLALGLALGLGLKEAVEDLSLGYEKKLVRDMQRTRKR